MQILITNRKDVLNNVITIENVKVGQLVTTSGLSERYIQ